MTDWYYAQGTTQQGPVAVEFLLDALRSGRMKAEDLVWHDGMAQWMPAGRLQELAGALAGAPPLQPPPVGAVPFAGPGAPHYAGVQYGQPYYPPTPARHQGLAITSMVLGILSMCCFTLLAGIPALVCGLIAMNGMKRTGDTRGKGMAIAGVVLGSMGTALGVAYIIFMVCMIFAAPHSMAVHSTFQSPPTWQPSPANP